MKSEAKVQGEIRLAASEYNTPLLRNNNGACFDKTGRLIRYGLGHDSARINEHFKSSDLIGINPVIITQAMVGTLMGQFVAVEVKPEGWTFPRETNKAEYARCNAQRNFGEWVVKHGGVFTFAQSVQDVWGTR